jgi:hypothetical protein
VETTSRVMAADRPYGEFYDFHSVSPEYFGYTLVILLACSLYYCRWDLYPCLISRKALKMYLNTDDKFSPSRCDKYMRHNWCLVDFEVS